MWEDDEDSEQWDSSDEENFKQRKDQIYKHPMMLKALEINKLTRALVGSLDEARSELYGGLMTSSATLLASKFAGAEAVSDYIIKMENAVIIKVEARSLYTMTRQLSFEETHAEEHLQLLRDAIMDYKVLFVEWVRGFDKTDRIDDGWGLFMD